MPKDAPDLVRGTQVIDSLDDHPAAAPKYEGNKFLLVLSVLRPVTERHVERPAEAFKHRRLAAALNADQAV
ncbi:hypothetical protein D3C87_1347170 [compost metagenome]